MAIHFNGGVPLIDNLRALKCFFNAIRLAQFDTRSGQFGRRLNARQNRRLKHWLREFKRTT